MKWNWNNHSQKHCCARFLYALKDFRWHLVFGCSRRNCLQEFRVHLFFYILNFKLLTACFSCFEACVVYCFLVRTSVCLAVHKFSVCDIEKNKSKNIHTYISEFPTFYVCWNNFKYCKFVTLKVKGFENNANIYTNKFKQCCIKKCNNKLKV